MTYKTALPTQDCTAVCPKHGNTCHRRIGPGHGKYPQDWQQHQCKLGPAFWQEHYFTQDQDPEGKPLQLWKES